MYKFDELDALIDHLLDDEIQAYDLPYYMEPMLEDISFVGLLEAYLEEAIAHKNADRIEGVLILAGKLGEDNWHHSHEDLVDTIEYYGNASNVATLQKAFSLSLPYMAYNHHYSFHRKLLYAILKLAPEQFPQIRKAVQGKLCDRLRKESFK